MDLPQKSYDYLEDYLDSLRAKGRYAFSWEEAKQEFSLTDKALNQNLFRLKARKKIVQIRKGYYAVIPPEYAAQGMIPVPLFLDDMMKTLNHRYYVGLVSAAALHGAAHQQPMESSVITKKPTLRNINSKMIKVRFYIKKTWEIEDIVNIKTDAGYINVSSPELTALDLFYYISSIGINQAADILRELAEVLKPSKLSAASKRFSQTTALQRLGYVLDVLLQNDALSAAVFKVLSNRRTIAIPLVPGKEISGELNPKWKIIKNVEIEIE